jgi:hypothetical protein
MSLNLLVLGALKASAMAVSVSLSLKPLTPSEPSSLALGVLGFFPSDGGRETDSLGVGASAASFDRLEIGVCPPVGTDAFFFVAIVISFVKCEVDLTLSNETVFG